MDGSVFVVEVDEVVSLICNNFMMLLSLLLCCAAYNDHFSTFFSNSFLFTFYLPVQ